MADIEEVIQDSITDAEMPNDPIEDTDTTSDTPVEVEDASGDISDEGEGGSTSQEVKSPAAQSQAATEGARVKDDFEKKYGITKDSSSGRENRIPYSRVKKIVEKQAKEVEATYAPKLAEFETKVKDYEGRLTKVAEFEKVMVEEPARFLQMLATLPQYKAIFEATPPAQETPTQPQEDGMPQPDQKLSDGTMVYSLEGLKALNTWNRAQARKETMDEVSKRFGPIESEWQAHQQVQRLIPQVQAQINDARTWPQFTENEADIVKVLQSDPKISLERAYQTVVYPKLLSNRDSMRADILKELKKAPTSTSAPSGASKPGAQSSGPRSLEDVISDSLKDLR